MSSQTLNPSESVSELLSEGVRSVLAIFDRKLGEVKFPGVDRTTLAGELKRVEEARKKLLVAEAAVEEALEAQQSSIRSLAQHAEQARDYALVFSRSDGELTGELGQISFGGPRRAPRKKRNGAKQEGADSQNPPEVTLELSGQTTSPVDSNRSSKKAVKVEPRAA